MGLFHLDSMVQSDRLHLWRQYHLVDLLDQFHQDSRDLLGLWHLCLYRP